MLIASICSASFEGSIKEVKINKTNKAPVIIKFFIDFPFILKKELIPLIIKNRIPIRHSNSIKVYNR